MKVNRHRLGTVRLKVLGGRLLEPVLKQDQDGIALSVIVMSPRRCGANRVNRRCRLAVGLYWSNSQLLVSTPPHRQLWVSEAPNSCQLLFLAILKSFHLRHSWPAPAGPDFSFRLQRSPNIGESH
jgi:hypothetical protein